MVPYTDRISTESLFLLGPATYKHQQGKEFPNHIQNRRWSYGLQSNDELQTFEEPLELPGAMHRAGYEWIPTLEPLCQSKRASGRWPYHLCE